MGKQKKKQKDLSLGELLKSNFSFVITLFSLALLLAYIALFRMAGFTIHLKGTHMDTVDASWDARRNLVAGTSNLYKMCVDEECRDEFAEDMEVCDANLLSALDIISSLTSDYDAQLSEFHALNERLESAEVVIEEYIYAGDIDTAAEMIENDFSPIADEMAAILVDICETATAKADTYVDNAKISFLVTLAVLLMLSGYAYNASVKKQKQLITNICSPIQEIEAGMKEMAEGNLNFTLTYESENELGQLCSVTRSTAEQLKTYIENIDVTLHEISNQNFDVSVDIEYKGMFSNIKASMEQIIASLNRAMSNVLKSTTSIDEGSKQIATISTSLAEGTAEQASSIEELFASIQTLNEEINVNFNNIGLVSTKATEAKEEIQQDDEKMEYLVTAMTEISESTREIADILSEIQGIATQTNLLALNASIEAARAGESGKGFAVVATQIGELSLRTNEATKTIEDLIQKNLHSVEEGNKVVEDTAAVLHKVVDVSTHISDLATEVANASSAQSNALSEVTVTLNQISGVVENNSALAQETAASCQESNSNIDSLVNTINEFRLKS